MQLYAIVRRDGFSDGPDLQEAAGDRRASVTRRCQTRCGGSAATCWTSPAASSALSASTRPPVRRRSATTPRGRTCRSMRSSRSLTRSSCGLTRSRPASEPIAVGSFSVPPLRHTKPRDGERLRQVRAASARRRSPRPRSRARAQGRSGPPRARGRPSSNRAKPVDRDAPAGDVEHRPHERAVHVAHERVSLDPELEQPLATVPPEGRVNIA